MSLIRNASSLIRQTLKLWQTTQIRRFSNSDEATTDENTLREMPTNEAFDKQELDDISNRTKILVSGTVRSQSMGILFPTYLNIQMMGRVIGLVRTKEIKRAGVNNMYAVFSLVTGHFRHTRADAFTQRHQVIVPDYEADAFGRAVRLMPDNIVGLSGELHYRYYMHQQLGIFVPYVEIVAEKIHFKSSWHIDYRRGGNNEASDPYNISDEQIDSI